MMLYRIDSAYTSESLMVGPLDPDLTWMAGAIGRTVCDLCRCIDRSRFPEPCDVVLKGSVEEQTVATVAMIHLQVFRRDLVTILEHLMKDFALGQVVFVSDTPDAEWVTCYCHNWITLWGGCQSKYSMCPKCGAVLSHLGNSPEFVHAGDLTGRHVYQDSECRLYLSEEGARVLDESRWDDIVLSTIPVHDCNRNGV